ncbi:dynamin family protein [Aliarcobacter cryaerophilus]|uniref:dynamin family protein n=1 Tax=Aliarcobacter cryaerophilus TaxID=28198 RepID=UPI0021B3602C|nr:dynamin family protein [Aliarcobacter cryaerophilus]MCT7525935.1 dynamin family protein [Aliarcobacter cryaerophilus]
MVLSENDKFKKTGIIKSIEDIELFFNKEKFLLNNENLMEKINSLSTVKKELNSNKYFIAIIGGIKTGKSTLINLLCHKEVSKTQAGVETTKIPLIISANSEDKINIYRKKGEIGDSLLIEEKDRDLVINYIKGLDEFDENNENSIGKEIEDYDEDKLYKYVTDDSSIDNSSMIIAIHLTLDKERLKEYPNCLLLNDIMIIDTPGLDGVESSIGGKENNNGDWLVERTDLIFILQSTVSPINKNIKDTLKKINNKNLKSRLVHNQFSLRDWLEKDKKENWENDTRKKSIDKALEILDKKGAYTDCVDLAMASDTVFSKEDLVNKKEEYSDKHIEELLKKSNFSEFEKNTNDELKKTKEKSHFDSCINQIRNLKLSEVIKEILKGIEAKEKENKEKFDKLIESFDFQKIKIDYEKWADFDNDEINKNPNLSKEDKVNSVKIEIEKNYLTNQHRNNFTEYLLSREIKISNDEKITVKDLIEFFNINYSYKYTIKTGWFEENKEEIRFLSFETYIKDKLSEFISESINKLNGDIKLGPLETKSIGFSIKDDPEKINSKLKHLKTNYLREYMRKNLESKLIEIFDNLSTYLKNNNEILEEKNKEISEEKETINDLGVKINALNKIL